MGAALRVLGAALLVLKVLAAALALSVPVAELALTVPVAGLALTVPVPVPVRATARSAPGSKPTAARWERVMVTLHRNSVESGFMAHAAGSTPLTSVRKLPESAVATRVTVRPRLTGAEHAVVQDSPTSGTARRPPALVAASAREGVENVAVTVRSLPAGEMLHETASAAMQLALKPSKFSPSPAAAERWMVAASKTRVVHVALQLVAPASNLNVVESPCKPETEPPPETFSVKIRGG